MDVISAEQYGVVPVNANKQRYPRSSLTPPGLRRARWSLQPADRIRLTAFDCIPGFVTDGVTNKTVPWKWNWFQGCRLDIYPTPPQKSLIKLIKHEHIAKNEYQKTHLAIMDNPGNDLYLSAPQIEIDPRESVQMQARGGSVMSSAANEVKPEDQVKQNVGVIPPQQTTRDYVASMPRKVDTVSMQTHRDTPSSMSSDPNVHFEQKPNVAMLKQAMNTATPPTMNPSTSQQIMQQQDMHYDAQGLDSKGSIGMLPGPEPISKTRGTRKRNSGNSTRGGGGVRQRRTNSKTQDKDQPLVPGTSTGGMGPGPQGYHPQQQQQMQHGWQGQQTAGYQPGQMYQAPQPGAGQMGGSSMPQGSHTMGYGPLPTGHQAQPPTHPQPMTTQAHIQQSMQQQAMQSQSQQPLADQQQIHMQHASTHHASHPQHAQQSAAAASGGTGQGHTINPEARSKLAKLATDRMQRKDERGGSISGPSGAEAQAAATHQAPPTQTQPIDTTKMRIKQEIVDRQSHTPNTQTQMYQQQQQAQSQQQQQHFNIKQEYGANNMGQPLPQASSGGGFAQGQRTSATNIHQQQQQHYQSQAQQSQQQPNAPVSHSGPGMGQVGPQPRNQQGQVSSRSDLESSNYSAHMQTSQPQASHQMHLQQGHQTQAAHGAMPQQQQQQQQQRQMGPGAGRQQMTQSQQQQLAMMQQQRQAQAGFQGQQGNYGAGHYDMQGQQGMSGSDQMSHQQGGPQQASQQQIGGAYPQHPQMQQQQQQQYYQQQQMMGGYQGDHPANMQQAQQQRAQMAQQQQFRQGAYGNQGMMQQQQHNYQGNPNQGYQR
ncbi:hypothetical protein WR25_23747 [Diploscapter pachys]|uniref:Uncharacterized protein n=1 Tax=Diploscapter pachys TaxID=2018661 RepID=A0A2A2JFM7_9BILA|nr:hypothetical protein WR25_23747 [Diploscapter pachys]